MTKQSKQQQGQKAKGHGKQHATKMGDVGWASANASAARLRKRKVAKLLDGRRTEERQSGEFYARVNSDRSTDLDAALAGEVGSYAYPGGDQPSIHFAVVKEARRTDSVSVIHLETIQEGHPLARAIFDPKVYVPCFYVQKFGTRFQSKLTDRLAAATQQLIVHYFANPAAYVAEDEESLDKTAASVMSDDGEDHSVDSVFLMASSDHEALLAEMEGDYLVPSPEGDVVVRVFAKGQKRVLRAVASRNPDVTPSGVFIPVYLLFKPSLEQVTSTEFYQVQLALFMFMRTELGELISRSRPIERYVAPPSKQASVPTVVPTEPPQTAVNNNPVKLLPPPLSPQHQAEEVDVTEHQPFTVRQFLTKDAVGIFHHGMGETLAYFRMEKIAGNQSFVLIAVDEGHVLQPCLEAHDTVHVHLQDLRRDDGPYDGNVTVMRNARECVRQYLRTVARSLGLGPVRPKEAVTSAGGQSAA